MSAFRRSLLGAPRLRRDLSDQGSARVDQYREQLSGIDPVRFKGLYRERLGQLVETDRNAEPVAERMDIEEKLKDAKLTSSQREILNEKLRQNTGGFGSVAARQSPYNYGSIAQRDFASLYRR